MPHGPPMARAISLSPATGGSGGTNNCKKDKSWACPNPLQLRCHVHRHTVEVRCGRWRTCPACAAWRRWTLTQRLLAGIEQTPDGLLPMFVTLTFPRNHPPDETAAHKALRSLVARLRYRNQLGAYSWVLERQSNGDPNGRDPEQRLGTLHYHGIWHMPWLDGLDEWRDLIIKSGFGPRNRIAVAERDRAYYCTKYIGKNPAELRPLRRAFGLSRDFPRTDYELQLRERLALHTIRADRHPARHDLQDPGDQMVAVEFEAMAAHMANRLGVEHDQSACAWKAA